MRVGVLIRFRTVGVVHAGVEVGVGEDLVLVIKAESVGDLLAHYQISPCRFVVG